MIRYSPCVVLAFFFIFAPLSAVADSLHSGYWRQSTPDTSPDGETFKCSLATTQKSMKSILNRAGWDPEKQRYPEINWHNNEVAIIAKGENLDFYGLLRKNNEVVLSYGWTKPSRRPLTPPDDRWGWGTEAATQFSRVGSRSIIVISYPKNLNTSDQFFCRGKPYPD